MRLLWRWGVVGALALALVAGCSGQGSDSGQSEPPKPVLNKDRDAAAVVSALRQIDACALLDSSVAGQFGIRANRNIVTAPHKCELDGSEELRVLLGDKFGLNDRFVATPLELAGAKAYLRDEVRDKHMCTVFVPVSFELAVSFEARAYKSTAADLCGAAKALAGFGVQKLANPDSVKASPAKRGFVQWDACSLLNLALKDKGQQLVFVQRTIYGVDGCKALPDLASVQEEFSIEVSYDRDPAQDTSPHKALGGKTVSVRNSNSSCIIAWAQGPSYVATGNGDFSQVVIEVQGDTCAKAEQGAVAVMPVAATNPAEVQPLRPVLYQPNEADQVTSGACAYINVTPADVDKCRPYASVAVPGSAQGIIDAAAQNPSVVCEIAQDAVQQRFGQTEKALYGTACMFVVPDRSLQIQIDISKNQRVADANLLNDGRSVNIGGKPGFAFDRKNDTSLRTELYISLVGDVSKVGSIRAIAEIRPPRGSNDVASLDANRAKLIEAVMNDVISKNFR